MRTSIDLVSSSSAYVRIASSGIVVNLIQYGTSMVTRGSRQDLILDPGTFSEDPDTYNFNSTASSPVSFSHYNDVIHILGLDV